MEHEMKLQPEYYNFILNGTKRIEIRLFDEKRQKLRPGDEIRFHHAETGETLTRYVVRLHRHPTFASLLEALPPEAFGRERDDPLTVAELYAYYTPEEEKKWGALGIELCEDEDVRAHMTEREAWDYTAGRVFEKYDAAFRELAKL